MHSHILLDTHICSQVAIFISNVIQETQPDVYLIRMSNEILQELQLIQSQEPTKKICELYVLQNQCPSKTSQFVSVSSNASNTTKMGNFSGTNKAFVLKSTLFSATIKNNLYYTYSGENTQLDKNATK